MILVLTLVTTVSLLAVAAGLSQPRIRWLVLIGGSTLVFVLSTVMWWYLMYVQLVSFEALLAQFNIYRTEGWLGAAMFFGPPSLAVVVFMLGFWRFAVRS